MTGSTQRTARVALYQLAIGVCGMALAACAAGKAPRLAQTAMPDAFLAIPDGQDVASLDRWWILYQDPQLSALTERALSRGFSVREAIARLDEARAARAGSLSAFNPQGDLQANADYRDTTDVDSRNAATVPGLPAGFDLGSSTGAGVSRTASVSLPVSWELDLLGRRGATRRGADADVLAARFDTGAAQAAIAAEVARSLFQSRGLAVQLQEARDTERIQGELLRVVAARAELGIAATSEADRVAGDVAQAVAQAAEFEAALTASRRALLAVVGDATDPLATVEITAALQRPPLAPATLPSDLLVRRPDVRRAEAAIAKAASSVRLAELAFFPRLTLNPGVGLTAQRGAFDSTTGFWSLGAGLAVPILDRPRLRSQLNVQGARAEQSVLAYERTVQTAFSEADQALVKLKAGRSRVETLIDGEARARRAYDAAVARYDLGFADLQEALDAERAWRATRATLTNARIDTLQRSVQVFQALGGGWVFPPAAQISRK